MAEDRTSDTPEEGQATAPAAKSAGFMAWLPLIVTIVLMPALAYGITQFVILPQLQKGLGGGSAAASSSSAKNHTDDGKEKTVSVPMAKLLVNVAGTMGSRYLQCSLSIVGTDPDLKTRLDDHDAQLRDMACGILAAKSLADLEKPGERNLIRNELIAGFNSILGDSTVTEIYFPEFAIQ